MDNVSSLKSLVPSDLAQEPKAGGEEQILTESGFYWRERDGVKVLVCRELEAAGFANGSSTRLGGVSSLEGEKGTELNLSGFNEDLAENIYENRHRFLAVFDRPYELATVWQVHGDNIKVIKTKNEVKETDEKADAVISDLTGTLAGVKTADCVPVLVGDPRTGGFAAIHAGWRGTAQSIVQKAIAKMGEVFGSQTADLICAIGPAAGCEMYEVGQEVIDLFTRNFSTGGKYFTKTRPGHSLVDLKAANRDQLFDAGVKPENIYIAPYCTIDRVDLFFSYRIEKNKFGRTGRLLSVIGRK